MDNIFDQLYQIETTASSILDRAQAKKKQLALAQEERIRAFREQTQRETEEEIKKQKEQINARINADLEQEKQLTSQLLSRLEEEYESNHCALAKQLLADLIKE